MAGPIALASALARLIEIQCPWCRHKKLVSRKPVAYHVCPKCKKHFNDARTSAKKR